MLRLIELATFNKADLKTQLLLPFRSCLSGSVYLFFPTMVARELDRCLEGLQYCKNVSETPGLLLRQSVENRKRVTTRKHLLL